MIPMNLHTVKCTYRHTHTHTHTKIFTLSSIATLFIRSKNLEQPKCPSPVNEKNIKNKQNIICCNIGKLHKIVFSEWNQMQRTAYGMIPFITAVPNLFGTRGRFCGRQFFHGLGVGGWFQDDSRALHLLCTLFLLLLHLIHNEIIQLTIMQNQWEPCACFHLELTDRVLIWVCKQLIYYGLCAVRPLCWW